MIPKVIHYCWFGGNPLPELALKCIESWKRYCPDYEIKRWDESNFDVNVCDYAKEAYAERKWAYVSDFARFWILYHEGGIYFDTDVEVLKPLDDIAARGAFMGVEAYGGVAPGLGLGAEVGMTLYKEILDYYQGIHYKDSNTVVNDQTVVDHTTEIMKRYGWRDDGMIQEIQDVTIYPSEYFCPKNYYSGETFITENTVCIHHYSASWHSALDKIIYIIEKCDRRKHPAEYKMKRVCSLPFRVFKKGKNIGVLNAAKFAIRKIGEQR